MKRSQLNSIVDIAAFVSFTFLTVTGILLRYLLPPGSGHASVIWGLDRHAWGSVHFWISLTFFAILAIHLALHWQWIVRVAKGRKNSSSNSHWFRPTAGIVGVLALIALSAAILFSPVETISIEKSEYKKGLPHISTREGEISVEGSMTLREIESLTGVPAQYLLGELGLNSSTSVDEKIGRLSRQHGFSLSEARVLIGSYKE